jgi:CRP/FNR family transcriptional regulator
VAGLGHRVDLFDLFDFFDFLSDTAREDFLASARTRVVPAGGRIYVQDDRHRVMYRVVAGRACLSYSRADGRELIYHFLGPGECLGISALVDGEGLPQSATARTRVTLQAITQESFERLRSRPRPNPRTRRHHLARAENSIHPGQRRTRSRFAAVVRPGRRALTAGTAG